MRAGLGKYSPHLAAVVRRRTAVRDVSLLEEAFAFALAHGASAEEPLRPPGMAFNPRPARVAQIVIESGGLSEAEAIAAAILSCAAPGELSGFSAGERAVELARASRAADVAALCRESVVIAAARLLDDLRHAHLFPGGVAVRQAELAERARALRGHLDAGARSLRDYLAAAEARISGGKEGSDV